MAELVGASHLLVRRWIDRDHLPHVEIGRYNYIRLKDVERLLKTGRPPGISRKNRRSTYSSTGSKSPAELRNMLWKRYQYSKRVETKRAEKLEDALEKFPCFSDWIFNGGDATKQTLRLIEEKLDGVDLVTFLKSLELQ